MNISIRLSGKCNLRCKMCSSHKNSGEDMSFENYLNILDQCSNLYILGRRVARINLSGSHEPLMYPRLSEAVKKTCERGFGPVIITNGVLLNKSKSEELLSAGLRWIRFSVTGITPSIYYEFQGYGGSLAHAEKQLNTVVDNITEFVRLSKKIAPNTHVEVSYILDKTSLPDINNAYFFWKKVGVTQFLVKNIGGHKSERFRNERDIDTSCLTKSSTEPFCLKNTRIIPNGDIYPCCMYPTVMGNCFEKPLKEIFSSEAFYGFASIIGNLDANNLPARCLTCEQIKYEDKYQLHI